MYVINFKPPAVPAERINNAANKTCRHNLLAGFLFCAVTGLYKKGSSNKNRRDTPDSCFPGRIFSLTDSNKKINSKRMQNMRKNRINITDSFLSLFTRIIYNFIFLTSSALYGLNKSL